ncbi:metallophosphoesterase 1-like isoform X2 [Coccinella septempunctata]|uniref:metallophosphoesterase 1-like isoform X2 n=1 Tax=Coccinella septempunctata TaxID=41139 RepID=UPI001D073E9A|nr:metallophosphoesterase 1-like isoform X2 [Coccinella septempunctata]
MVRLLKKTWQILHTPISVVYSALYGSRFVITEVSLALLVLIFYCEYLHYKMVIQQCFWPALSPDKEDFSIPTTNENRLKVMVLADIHLKCTRASWQGTFNEEDQMRRCFQNAVQHLKPDLVFVLGDILDEGMQHCNLKEFNDTVQRFHDIFSVPNETEMYVVAGNVEVGYHHQIDVDKNEEFMDAFKSPLVQFLTIRKNNFVLLNSMALGSDNCSLCAAVEKNLSEIEKKLNCSQEANRGTCEAFLTLPVYSRPILIQHLPLYRTSDANCNDYDSAPFPRKLRNMAEYWQCLSRNLTASLMMRLNPRIVFSGHTHHGCTRSLPMKTGVEVTMSSFNWRKKDNPALGLVSGEFSFSGSGHDNKLRDR